MKPSTNTNWAHTWTPTPIRQEERDHLPHLFSQTLPHNPKRVLVSLPSIGTLLSSPQKNLVLPTQPIEWYISPNSSIPGTTLRGMLGSMFRSFVAWIDGDTKTPPGVVVLGHPARRLPQEFCQFFLRALDAVYDFWRVFWVGGGGGHNTSALGSWLLRWFVSAGNNCSDRDTQPKEGYEYEKSGLVRFTIDPAGKAPEVIASGSCAVAAETFVVEKLLTVTGGPYFENECPVLWDTEPYYMADCEELPGSTIESCGGGNTSNADPCAVKVDDAVASSVLATMKETAGCTNGSWPTASCPPQPTVTKSGATKLGFGQGIGSMFSMLLLWHLVPL